MRKMADLFSLSKKFVFYYGSIARDDVDAWTTVPYIIGGRVAGAQAAQIVLWQALSQHSTITSLLSTALSLQRTANAVWLLQLGSNFCVLGNILPRFKSDT